MDFSYFRKLVNQISFALHSTYISYYEIQIRLFFDSSLNILGAFWERGSERSKKNADVICECSLPVWILLS